MKRDWECKTTDDLFALHEQIGAVLREKLIAKKTALERRLQILNQQSKVLETVKPGPLGLLFADGNCGCAWKLLPLAQAL